MATTADLTVIQGDDYTATISVVDSGGSPVDLSGGSYAAQIRDKYGSGAAVLATFSVDSTDAATGVFVLSLTSAVTAALDSSHLADPPAETLAEVFPWGYWDFEVTIAGVTRKRGRGKVRFVREVTK